MKTRRIASSSLLAGLCTAFGLAVFVVRPSAAPVADGIPVHPDPQTINHVLNRIGFGARPGDVERVEKIGLAAYIDQQLYPDRVPDEAVKARLAAFTTITMSSHELAEKFFVPQQQLQQQLKLAVGTAPKGAPVSAAGGTNGTTMADPGAPATTPAAPTPTPEQRQIQLGAQNVINELMQQRVLRAAISDRQLEEVLTDFWFNHFNVFLGKGQPEREYITEYERDVIRPHVLGSFRELLGATAHSPAMLFYLDNFQSVDPKTQGGRGNGAQLLAGRGQFLTPAQRAQLLQRMQAQAQGQARGLNENYGRELMELHTLGVDGGYTQADVIAVARALTGWTINQPRQGGSFQYQAANHDAGEKTILGEHFPAGHGQDEGERVLDILARHPSTAHHIAYQLAQRFVADEPPPALVDRAAKKFLETNGDLREVTRLIITSPEFFAADAYGAKMKTPFEFVISAVRASAAVISNAQPIIQQLQQSLGMPLYGCQPPTGYSNTADAWLNTGALLNRMNFALQLVGGAQAPPPQRGRGAGAAGGGGGATLGRPGLARGPLGQQVGPPMKVDVETLIPDMSDASREHLIQQMFAGQISDSTKQTLARAQTPAQLLALALGSPEFQRR
jgi:uncharacterized protein (DUF1800 family)